MSTILPGVLRRLRKPYRAVRSFRLWQRYTLRIFRGTARGTELPLRMAYAGKSNENRHWLVDRVFGDRVEIEHERRLWAVQAQAAVLSRRWDSDLAVCETLPPADESRVPSGSYLLPFWVELAMGITDADLKGWWERYRKIRSQIRKSGLSYAVRSDWAAFESFYHTMYIPHIRHLYGPAARTAPYEYVRSIHEESLLLLAMQGDTPVAGILIHLEHREPVLRVHGVLDAAPQYVKAGAFSSLVLFAVEELRSRGFDRINFGGSRPILNDGPLNFKRLFRASVVEKPQPRDGDFMLTPRRDTPAVRQVLRANPFAFWRGKPLMDWAVFIDRRQLEAIDTLCDTLQHLAVAGLQTLHLHVFDAAGTDSLAEAAIPLAKSLGVPVRIDRWPSSAVIPCVPPGSLPQP
jgi:hypothetical protein